MDIGVAKASRRKTPGETARKIELYSSAYKLARGQIPPLRIRPYSFCIFMLLFAAKLETVRPTLVLSLLRPSKTPSARRVVCTRQDSCRRRYRASHLALKAAIAIGGDNPSGLPRGCRTHPGLDCCGTEDALSPDCLARSAISARSQLAIGRCPL